MTEPIAGSIAAQASDTNVRVGTITVISGSPLTATVQCQGGDLTNVGWLQTYHPAVGDSVLLVLNGQSWIALGSIGAEAPTGSTAIVRSTGSSSPITTEAVVLGVPAMTWKARSAYACIVEMEIAGSVAGNSGILRLRRNSLAGAIKWAGTWTNSPTPGNQSHVYARAVIVNSTDVDVVDSMFLTLQVAGGGTVTSAGTATQVRYVDVRYLDSSSRYAGWPTI